MAYMFDGKRALVTGGSRGIGRAIVKALVDAGAEVYAIAKTQVNLDRLKTEIPKVHIITVDLADWEATRIAVENIGDIDLLVNNAVALIRDEGSQLVPFWDIEKSQLDMTLNVNLKAVFNISQIVARNLIKRSCGGAIVNMSSTAGLKAFKNLSLYNINKAGMDMMTKVMALELGPQKIRVNSVSPTFVHTEKFKDYLELQEKYKPFFQRHPLGKFAEMGDIVNATLFLLSEQASMITGTILPVDGGYIVS